MISITCSILLAQFIFCCRMYFHALGSDAERLVEVVARLAYYAAAEAVGQVFLTESHVTANPPVHCSVCIFKLHIFTAEVPVYSFSSWKEDTATLPKPRHTLFCQILLFFFMLFNCLMWSYSGRQQLKMEKPRSVLIWDKCMIWFLCLIIVRAVAERTFLRILCALHTGWTSLTPHDGLVFNASLRCVRMRHLFN